MNRTPLIELVDVDYERRSGVGLRGVTLQIWRGETVAIRGPAGAGKTTLLRIMAGILEPTRGAVRYSATGSPEGAEHHAGSHFGFEGVAFLSERPSFLLALSVVEQVMVGLLARGLRDHALIRRRAMCGLLGAGLMHMASTPMAQLCLPERRLVLLAEVLAIGAPVVFVDQGYGQSVAKLASPERTIIIAASGEVGTTVDRSLTIDAGGSIRALDPRANEAA